MQSRATTSFLRLTGRQHRGLSPKKVFSVLKRDSFALRLRYTLAKRFGNGRANLVMTSKAFFGRVHHCAFVFGLMFGYNPVALVASQFFRLQSRSRR